MIPKFPCNFVRYVLGVFATFICCAALAVPVGPRLPEEIPKASSKDRVFQQLNVPDLDFAVEILNPNVNENDDKLREKGIWPEVRKTESMRSAYRIKQAIEELNQFERVTVAPSTLVSADLYLRGRIDKSTSEVMEIRWTLIDARGFYWIDWKTSDHRVELGWHERFYEPGKDAFQPLWNEIANDVYAALKRFAKNHTEVQKQNASRVRSGKSARLSRLDQITHTRDIVLARFFNPGQYRDALKLNDKNQWEIRYLPDMTTEDWLRIQAFAESDAKVAGLYDTHYEAFFTKINPSYETWLNDVFPFAREMRLEQRRYKTERIVGGLVLAASALAAADADSEQSRENALALGTVVGGGLIVKSVIDQADFKERLNLFDEMTQNFHDSFAPINIEVQGEIVTLQGKADMQFSNWRQVLKSMYDQEQADAYAIRIPDE